MRILLVEDDEFFTAAVQGILTGGGYHVTTAENGKMAIYELDKGDFDCVLSDVQMPVLNGLELAKWMKENRASMPLILMTGFSDSIATLEAVSSGAANLLYKPFSADEILRALKLCALPKTTASTSDGAGKTAFSGYARIPSRSMMATAHAEFNLYVQTGDVLEKIVSRGEPYQPKNDILRTHSHFYTERENLESLIPINIMITKAAVKSEKVNLEKKAMMIQQSMELLFEKFDASGFDERAFGDSVEFVKCYMDSIEEKNVWDMINKTGTSGNYVQVFTMATTAMASMIAQAKNLSLQDRFKIATAALFHDIGKSQVDPIILAKPKPLMTATERAQVERHVDAGVRMLKNAQSVPEEILTIISQHHENCAGTGYPNRMQKDQIHPFARLLFVVDEFCTRIIKSPGHPGMPPEKALEQIRELKECDPVYIEVLATLVLNKGKKK